MDPSATAIYLPAEKVYSACKNCMKAIEVDRENEVKKIIDRFKTKKKRSWLLLGNEITQHYTREEAEKLAEADDKASKEIALAKIRYGSQYKVAERIKAVAYVLEPTDLIPVDSTDFTQIHNFYVK